MGCRVSDNPQDLLLAPPEYTPVYQLTFSRLSDYSLVKEHSNPYVANTYVFTWLGFSNHLSATGGGMLQSFPPVSTGVGKDFSSTVST
jgi:hypothetical protein